MELDNAIKLITKDVDKKEAPQTWADLGAGGGLFSHCPNYCRMRVKFMLSIKIIRPVKSLKAGMHRLKYCY